MLRNLDWDVTDALARNQLQLYHAVGEAIRMSDDDRRRVLLLSAPEWNAWTAFLEDGSLPSEPPLPVMLRRLGSATWRLSTLAERRRATA